MKTLFIEAEKKFDINIDNLNLNTLPKKIFLAYSIQYRGLAQQIKDKLSKKIIGFRQVLGCSKLKSKHPILLIGSGKFHAFNLAIQGNKILFLEGNKIRKLDEKQVSKIKAKRKTALSRFYAADKIGILVSTKPGQKNLKKAQNLAKKLEKKGKEITIFLADNINIDELENYDIQSWVNTACPALTFDARVVNLSELPNF